MNALVSLQGGCLGEVFATNIAAEGLVARVAHAVAQQALGVCEGLCAHLQTTIIKISAIVVFTTSTSCKGINKSCIWLNLLTI